MVISDGRVADELFQCAPFEVTGHDFAFCVRMKRSRISNLAAEFHTCNCSFQVVRVRKHIGLDLDRVVEIGTCQTNLPSAFRPYEPSYQCPGGHRRIELCSCFGAADW